MTNEIVPMAVEALLLATPGYDRAYLIIGVPGFWAGTQQAVMPAGGAVTEDRTRLVLSQECVDDGTCDRARSWNGIAQPSDGEDSEAGRKACETGLVIPG
jgi:hypothetical protein